MKIAFPSIVVVVFTALTACEPAAGPGEGEGEGESEGEGEGEGEGDGEGACPISPDALSLLRETVDQLFTNSSFAILNTHGGAFAPDLSYGSSLVGLEERVLQSATLAIPCTEPTTFDPTCETNLLPEGEPAPSPFYEEHDRCFRLGCSGDGQYFVDVYYVMRPNTLPEPRHEFTFELDTVAGATSVYAENPYVRWNSDLRVTDVVDITADVDVTNLVTLANETPIDVSHTGNVVAQYVIVAPDDQVTLDIVLAFPNIAAGGATVEVHGLPDGSLDGFIRVDGEDVATLGGAVNLDDPLAFELAAGCD